MHEICPRIRLKSSTAGNQPRPARDFPPIGVAVPRPTR